MQMLEEIAVGLKSGDEEIYGWLREQLKEAGGSDISVELAMGVIARLLPEDVQGVFHEAVAHRVFFNPVVELRRAEVAREFTRQVLEKVAAP